MGLWGHLVVFDGILKRIPESQHVVVISQKNILQGQLDFSFTVKNAF